jgi:acetate kinase
MLLALNAGSSSLKFALFDPDGGGERRLAEGSIERIGASSSRAWIGRGGERDERGTACRDHREALELAFELLGEGSRSRLAAVGHRVVHGGVDHVQPTRVDRALVEQLRELSVLAPLHLPASLAGIEAILARHPELPQVACFDTAFHASLPEVARRLPLPERFDAVRRYGFHGLSYESVMATLGASAPARIVIAHLGSGASLVAVRDGRAVDTTMSFTPSGGIPMGTRSGDLDPGILIYLLRVHGLDADALEQLIERESGLLALGGSADLITLLERSATEEGARLATQSFGYAVRKTIGAYAAALGGLDLLVFTGGIGQHAAPVRAEACRALEAFGVELDRERNERNADVVSTRSSRAVIRVIATREEEMIARHTRRVLGAG